MDLVSCVEFVVFSPFCFVCLVYDKSLHSQPTKISATVNSVYVYRFWCLLFHVPRAESISNSCLIEVRCFDHLASSETMYQFTVSQYTLFAVKHSGLLATIFKTKQILNNL